MMIGILPHRILAALIDFAILLPLTVLGIVIAFVFDFEWGWVGGALLLAAVCAYFGYTQGRAGASVGDRIVGIEVRMTTGDRVWPHTVVARFCGLLLAPYVLWVSSWELAHYGWLPWRLGWEFAEGSSYAVGTAVAISLVITKGHRGIHDLLSNTHVVRRGRTFTQSPTALPITLTVLVSLAIGLTIGRALVNTFQSTTAVLTNSFIEKDTGVSTPAPIDGRPQFQLSIGKDCTSQWNAMTSTDRHLIADASVSSPSEFTVGAAKQKAERALMTASRYQRVNIPQPLLFTLTSGRRFGPLEVRLRKSYVVYPSPQGLSGMLVICDPGGSYDLTFGYGNFPLGLL